MKSYAQMHKQKAYKHLNSQIISNRKIVSMIPGDREVAGCFNFSENYGDFKWKKL